MKRLLPLCVLLCLSVLLTSCAHRPINAHLRAYTPETGYYFHTHPRTNNSDDMLFILSFSGGGTRAAALACGVLEELAKTRITQAGKPRRLLDEVDAISSVSGGSVTAAAYALYGDAAFAQLETNFLKRNVQGALVSRTANPFNWCKLLSPTYGRSDMAAEYYDRVLFHGATFGDLAHRPGPYIVINATDVSTGARFDFTQYQFDLICSDLSAYPLSRAVAASSAVPAVLSPITLNNYAGSCGYAGPQWLATAGTNPVSGRVRLHAADVRAYLDSTNRPFLHLVDGGVSDNLGLRAVLDGLFTIEADPGLAEHYDLAKLTKVVVLCVNARSAPERKWDRKEAPPNPLQLTVASSTIPIERYSYETIELLKEQVDAWRRRVRDAAIARGTGARPFAEVRFYPVVISFADIPDPEERRYFLNQPTSFQLPPQAVDRLREVGGRLVRQSPIYQQLLQDLRASRVE